MYKKLIKVIYKGKHFVDLVGESVTTNELAERLNRTGNTIRVALGNAGAIERGFVTDDDISRYLPSAAVISTRKAALALSARAWR